MQGHEPKGMDTELDLLSDRAGASGADRILARLRERLGKFGLELAEEKTRRIEFGRYARRNAEAKGRKPESFDFLGFTHYIGKTRGGAFKVGRKTSRKKLNAKLKEMTQWIKAVRNLLLPKPKIHHDFYGLKCLFVNVTEEPYVGNPQVRFCEGR